MDLYFNLKVKGTFHSGFILLTLPYFACHAKKYSSAAKGWPTKQKLTQKMQFPAILPLILCIFSKGMVAMIMGIWTTIPKKATPSIAR
jgi:hypothetical protein